jgi:hypothetical protein
LYAVFDTNIYRGISTERLSVLRGLEAEHGVVALSAYWPALELIARLKSDDPKSASSAAHALLRMVEHAAYTQSGEQRIRVMADCEVELAGGLFGRRFEQRLLSQAAVAEFPPGHKAECSANHG